MTIIARSMLLCGLGLALTACVMGACDHAELIRIFATVGLEDAAIRKLYTPPDTDESCARIGSPEMRLPVSLLSVARRFVVTVAIGHPAVPGAAPGPSSLWT